MSKIWKTLIALGAIMLLTGAAPPPEPEFYVLREWNGKIALLEDGSSEPLTVYNTEVSSLYPADVELLREGIRVKTRAEVAHLIEDLDLE